MKKSVIALTAVFFNSLALAEVGSVAKLFDGFMVDEANITQPTKCEADSLTLSTTIDDGISDMMPTTIAALDAFSFCNHRIEPDPRTYTIKRIDHFDNCYSVYNGVDGQNTIAVHLDVCYGKNTFAVETRNVNGVNKIKTIYQLLGN